MASLARASADEAAAVAAMPADEAERNAERRAEERMVLEAIYADDVSVVHAPSEESGAQRL